jgi:hypothetical protein
MAFHLVLQVDWMNKFIFDMWPFLDKVLITNVFSVLFPASSICVMYTFGSKHDQANSSSSLHNRQYAK